MFYSRHISELACHPVSDLRENTVYKDEGKIENGWIIWAHIERKGVWDSVNDKGGYNIENFRTFNNIAPDSPDYTKNTHESTKVIKTFTSADWTVDAAGLNVITTTVPADKSMYYRLRGTNVAPNTAFETDAAGNPLADTEAANLGLDKADEAYADLWFYSNPIFVYAN